MEIMEKAINTFGLEDKRTIEICELVEVGMPELAEQYYKVCLAALAQCSAY